ncbi:signal peptidase I [Bifidobacterium gallicum]|nr:signal peptidase I [Bifidobacterium gallicum]KFI58313.1 signal peptidase [Bifidobacterium gallicum DSM 20093 = LMG 11596]
MDPEQQPPYGAQEPHAVAATSEPKPAKSAKKHTDASFGLKDFALWCGIPILIMVLLRVFVFGMYLIPSSSMEDTIMPGDRVITSQLTPRFGKINRGDIVVFKDPSDWLPAEKTTEGTDYLIKRVIGLPGDVVECAGNGAPVTINGVVIDEQSYIKPGVEPSAFAFNVTVTEGHLFVMGDNRANSADSRYHKNDAEKGLVPIADVKGVAFLRYWPLNRIGWLSAHHDVFAHVPEPKTIPSA